MTASRRTTPGRRRTSDIVPPLVAVSSLLINAARLIWDIWTALGL